MVIGCSVHFITVIGCYVINLHVLFITVIVNIFIMVHP